MTHTIYTFEKQDNWYYIKEVKTAHQVDESIFNLVIELEQLRKDRNEYEKSSPELVAYSFGKDINGRKLREGKKKEALKDAYSILCKNSLIKFGNRIKEITNILREKGIITGSWINDVLMEVTITDRQVAGIQDTFRD